MDTVLFSYLLFIELVILIFFFGYIVIDIVLKHFVILYTLRITFKLLSTLFIIYLYIEL